MSKVYQLKVVQTLPATIDKVWDFFSRPDNLQAITPPYMGFAIKRKSGGNTMYAGQLIEYTVRPLLGLPVYWMTEITEVAEHSYFIDEQRYGPYSMWHHQHHFTPVSGGVQMTDIVTYKIPFWFLGDLANVFLVHKKLQEIFDYRFKKAEEIFGVYPKGQESGSR